MMARARKNWPCATFLSLSSYSWEGQELRDTGYLSTDHPRALLTGCPLGPLGGGGGLCRCSAACGLMSPLSGLLDGGGFGVRPTHNQGCWSQAPVRVKDPKQLHLALSLDTWLAPTLLG